LYKTIALVASVVGGWSDAVVGRDEKWEGTGIEKSEEGWRVKGGE